MTFQASVRPCWGLLRPDSDHLARSQPATAGRGRAWRAGGEFRRRQFHRRVQTSPAFGSAGRGDPRRPVAHGRTPLVEGQSGVLDRCFGTRPLDRAVGDCRHGGHELYYSREKTDFVVQHAKLQAELPRPARKNREGTQRQTRNQRQAQGLAPRTLRRRCAERRRLQTR